MTVPSSSTTECISLYPYQLTDVWGIFLSDNHQATWDSVLCSTCQILQEYLQSSRSLIPFRLCHHLLLILHTCDFTSFSFVQYRCSPVHRVFLRTVLFPFPAEQVITFGFSHSVDYKPFGFLLVSSWLINYLLRNLAENTPLFHDISK